MSLPTESKYTVKAWRNVAVRALGLVLGRHYVCLCPGQKRRKGYQYRYREGRGWTPWLNGDDEHCGSKISLHTICQYRAPRLRK